MGEFVSLHMIIILKQAAHHRTSSGNLGSSAAVYRCCMSDTKLSRIPKENLAVATHGHTFCVVDKGL